MVHCASRMGTTLFTYHCNKTRLQVEETTVQLEVVVNNYRKVLTPLPGACHARRMTCRSCGSEGDCFGDCRCMKCEEPIQYDLWKNQHPGEWLAFQVTQFTSEQWLEWDEYLDSPKSQTWSFAQEIARQGSNLEEEDAREFEYWLERRG
jgi:hypothetical protein